MMADRMPDGADDGRTARFKALAVPHLDETYTLARYLLGRDSDAEDAVQECYLRALRHFDSFRGGPIKPWLLAILRNTCLATRAGSSRLTYTADQQTDGAAEPLPMWSEVVDTPEQSIIRRDVSNTMRRLIEDLPPEFREVIVLREINDLSYRDIAAVIEAPIGTVMSRLARGRKILREAWIASEDQRDTE